VASSLQSGTTSGGCDPHTDALRLVLDMLPVAELDPGKRPDMGKVALFYAERLGWPVLPIHHPIGKVGAPYGLECSCGGRCDRSRGKHPLTPNGLKDASTDPDVIRAWWARWPLANIAVRTGTIESGGIGFDVIDIDGPRGLASWQQAGIKVDVVHEAFTPGNRDHDPGRHLYVAACGTGNTSNELPGVDTRGDNGYVLAPPSLGMRGTRYAWVVAPA
jgi:putative DNA primase/helicase